jgi:hypothetical protein
VYNTARHARDQKVQPSAAPTLDSARASVPMAVPTAWNSDLLKDAAVDIAAGNDTGQKERSPDPPVNGPVAAAAAQPDCTPCRASDHQFWRWIQREGTVPATFTSSFSTSSCPAHRTTESQLCPNNQGPQAA